MTESVFVIGDSISICYGPFLEKTVSGQLRYARKEGLEKAFENLDIPEGANGGDSGMVLRYIEHKVGGEGFECDLLILNCGLHDIKVDLQSGKRQIDQDEYAENLRKIFDILRPLELEPVWVRTTGVDDELHAARKCGFGRVNSDVELYNGIADEIVAKEGLRSIDLYGFTAGLAEYGPLYTDGVHFREDICKLQGMFIGGYVLGMAD